MKFRFVKNKFHRADYPQHITTPPGYGPVATKGLKEMYKAHGNVGFQNSFFVCCYATQSKKRPGGIYRNIVGICSLFTFGRCIKIINPIPIIGSDYSRHVVGLSLLDMKMFRRAYSREMSETVFIPSVIHAGATYMHKK